MYDNNPSEGAYVEVTVDLGHTTVVWLLTGSELLEVQEHYGAAVTGPYVSHGEITLLHGKTYPWQSTFNQEQSFQLLTQAAAREGRKMTNFWSQAGATGYPYSTGK